MAPSTSWGSSRLAVILLLLTTVAIQSYGNTVEDVDNDLIPSAISEDRLAAPEETKAASEETRAAPEETKAAPEETKSEETKSSVSGTDPAVNVNGGWTAWSKCSKTCSDDGINFGVQTRTCTNPAPKNEGKTCLGSDSQPCNQQFTCKSGFKLLVSCGGGSIYPDGVFVDGKMVSLSPLVLDGKKVSDVRQVNIPANGLAVEIRCTIVRRGPTVGGFIASSDNGLISDESWQRSSDNGVTWHTAKTLGANGLSPLGFKQGISTEAQFIWSEEEDAKDVNFKYTLDKLKLLNPYMNAPRLGCQPGAERRKVVELIRPCARYVISSPNYPESYDASNTEYHCHWTIKSQFGSNIKMHTLEANMKSSCLQNELQVYAQKYTDDSKLRRPGLKATCGNNNFTNSEDIITKDEIMVKFKSKKNLWSDKFDLLFESTPPTNCPAENFRYEGCPSWPNTCCEGDDCCVITAGKTPVAIQSPSYPDDSKENKVCKFKIKAPEGSHINLNFLDMDIMVNGASGNCDDSEDYVKVVDNSPGQTSIIGETGLKFCGNRLPNYPGPSVFVSGGNSLTITYTTGSTVAPRGRGFKADVSAINPWCGNTMTYRHKYGDQTCDQTCTQPIDTRCFSPCCKNKPNGKVKLVITVKDKATKEPVKGAKISLKTLVTNAFNMTNIIDMVKDSDEQGEGVFEMEKPGDGDYEVTIDGTDGNKRTPNHRYTLEQGSVKIDCSCKHVSWDCCICENCEEKKEFELIPYEPPPCPSPNEGRLILDITDERSKDAMSGVKVIITAVHSTPRPGYKLPEIVNHAENATTNDLGIVDRKMVFNGNYTFTIFETKRDCDKTTITKIIDSNKEPFNCTTKIPVELKCPWCDKAKKKLTITVMNCDESLVVEDAYVTIEYKGKTILNNTMSTGGTVGVDMVDNGDYKITVQKEHYTTKTFSKSIDFTRPEDFKDCSTNLTKNICPTIDPPHCLNAKNVSKEANFTLEVVVKSDGTDEILSDAKVTIIHENKTHIIPYADSVPQGKFPVQSNGNYKITAELEKDGYETKIVSKDVICTKTKPCSKTCSLIVEIRLISVCAPPNSSLTITVTDEEIKKKVDNANVKITLGNKIIYEGRTAKGIVETDQTHYTGTYLIKISKDKYIDSSKEYTLVFTKGNCQKNIKIILSPELCPSPNNITVTVHDNKLKHRIVADATVKILLISSPADAIGHNIESVPKTNSDGTSTISTKFKGLFRIIVEKKGYRTAQTDMEILDICLVNETRFDLEPIIEPCVNFKFNLIVKDCVTQEKIEKASIMVEHKEHYRNEIIKAKVTEVALLTNADGNLIIEANQDGEYIFTLDKRPFYIKAVVSKTVNCKLFEVDKVIDVDFANENDIVTRQEPLCPKHCENLNITITVKEKFKNKLIEGGSVSLSFDKPYTEIGMSTRTNEKGVAIINVPKFTNGYYTVKFRHDKFKNLDKSKLFRCDSLENIDDKSIKQPCECPLEIELPVREKACEPKPSMKISVKNSLDNTKLNGATVTVKIVGCETPSVIYNGPVDSTSAIATVSLETAGTYLITVSNSGFITQTKTVTVNLSPPCPDLDLNIRLSPEHKDKNCTDVTVSLTWKENPKDLDLFSWDGCLTYYCEPVGKKPQCPCTNFANDNRAGGLKGSETIEYKCCEETSTHMIYVDDRSGKGLHLMESGAELIINGRESMPIRLEKIQTMEKPRYWLAGCLTIGKDGYHFEYLNEFTRIPPHISNNQKCKRREKIRRATKAIDQETVLTIKAVDTENNKISGAQVEVSNNLVSYAGTTTSNGNVDIKVYTNGKYNVDVRLNGYISTRSKLEIKCINMNCKKDVNIQLTSLTSTTDSAKVTLLSDNVNGNKLELSDFKVKIEDHSETCRSSEGACNGVNINETFPQMASFSKGQNHGYTNMIIVSCKAENGCGDLKGIKPRVVVVEGEKSETYTMPEMGENAESNSKYWIAGCLKIVKSSFIFEKTNIFVHKDPSELNKMHRLYCHNKLQHTTYKNEDNDDWCDNAKLHIKIVHSNTGEIIQDAKATVHHIHDTEEILVAAEQGLVNGTGDKVSVKIGSNGKYLIHAKAPGFYPVSEQIKVQCELTQCSACTPTILISMVPENTEDFKITMNWDEKPTNLDVIVYQTKKQYVKTSTCLAKTKSSTCKTVKITATNDGGGYNGGEEVTFDDTFKYDNYVYMVYVKDVSDEPIAFSKSNVRLTLTDSTSTSKIIKATDENFDNDKFWFAGCLRAKAGSFRFKPVNIYMKNPPNEVVPEACNEMFNLVIDPSNCFLKNRNVHCENMNDGVQAEEESAEHCYDRCAKTDKCVGFVWDEKTSYCWLKSSMTTITEQTGMISGFGKCTTPKAIDGGWSAWSNCTTTCGGGTRMRRCDNPLKDDDGQDCEGSDNEKCNEQTCPTNGKWSAWGPCSATCGESFKSRTCTDPEPKNGGASCEEGSSTTACQAKSPCPVNGEWGPWGSCSSTCGTSTRKRSCRGILNGGLACDGIRNGKTQDVEDCKKDACPMIGVWTAWTPCSKTCAGGARTRQCLQPNTTIAVDTCDNITHTTLTCNNDPCPINGGWTEYSACNQTCGGGKKWRECSKPHPKNNGKNCVGEALMDCNTQSCCVVEDNYLPINRVGQKNTGPVGVKSCAEMCLAKPTCQFWMVQKNNRNCFLMTSIKGKLAFSGFIYGNKACGEPGEIVNGAWSAWGAFGTCSVTCGDGTKTRERTCTSPAPANGGNGCTGSNQTTTTCNHVKCPSPNGIPRCPEYTPGDMEAENEKLITDLTTPAECENACKAKYSNSIGVTVITEAAMAAYSTSTFIYLFDCFCEFGDPSKAGVDLTWGADFDYKTCLF